MIKGLLLAVSFLVSLLASLTPSFAAETIKVAIGSGGNLEAFIVEIGDRGGFFEKQGLKPEVFYTAGGGETLQAVISQSAQFGVSIGATGAVGAFAKGAPLRIIGASTIGSANYWYVPTDSSIHKMEDIAGRTLAYSTTGSGTHAVALAVRARGIDAKLVATGNTGATFTQVMTGQVDVGFAFAEFGQDALAAGKIRVLFKDNDFERIRNQALRIIAVHKSQSADIAARFMRAYADSVDWIYSADPKPLAIYAEMIKSDIPTAKRLRDEFYSRDMLSVEKVKGLDLIIQDALDGKFIQKPLTPAQVEELVAPSARP
jgi:NitT/TauT family transport system substrate-binding protein